MSDQDVAVTPVVENAEVLQPAVEKELPVIEKDTETALVVENHVESESVDGVELVALVSAVINSNPKVKKSQIAEVISCGSIPGYWSVQIRYTNDKHESCVRMVYAGAEPNVEVGEYALWQSKAHYIEARFDDYAGIVLVPCPEVVSV